MLLDQGLIKWAPFYNFIKFNKDIAWFRGKVFMAMLVGNAKHKVLGSRYDNYKCASTIIAEFLAIQKALFVFHNFMGCDISKMIVKWL